MALGSPFLASVFESIKRVGQFPATTPRTDGLSRNKFEDCFWLDQARVLTEGGWTEFRAGVNTVGLGGVFLIGSARPTSA
jgi:hypothetical protein